MSLLRRAGKVSLDKSDESTDSATIAEAESANRPGAKGRPTPKRRDAEGLRRGPIAPPPMTQREAAKRSKEGAKSLTKAERKALSAERRERMKRGDDAFLMSRDKGKVRAWVRDQVDIRRNLAGLLMPLAVLSFVVLLIRNPLVQTFGPVILIIAILAAVVDGTVFGRRLAKDVRAEFPKGDGTNLSSTGRALGFYAFNRAMMPRRWRVPKPRVSR
ncbi:MAG: DUF3043 domain-containing protein [Actinomycetota bacterium]|nr:DUF3043 domain-containing protein [Actinomycetota bacterium]